MGKVQRADDRKIRKELFMAHCSKCHRELERGEGHPSMSWRHPGLVCDDCHESNISGVKAFFYLLFGIPIMAVGGALTCVALRDVAASGGFPAIKTTLLVLSGVSAAIWIVALVLKNKIGGCLTKMFFALVSFVMFWYAAGLAAYVFYDSGRCAKAICGIESEGGESK